MSDHRLSSQSGLSEQEFEERNHDHEVSETFANDDTVVQVLTEEDLQSNTGGGDTVHVEEVVNVTGDGNDAESSDRDVISGERQVDLPSQQVSDDRPQDRTDSSIDDANGGRPVSTKALGRSGSGSGDPEELVLGQMRGMKNVANLIARFSGGAGEEQVHKKQNGGAPKPEVAAKINEIRQKFQ